MKKNKMMRLASVMMVMTLMTTSVISGTFAKYVTQDDAKDSARVAKWGVTVAATGSLYGKKYAKDTDNKITALETDNAVSVWGKQATSPATNKVVAPGTMSDEGFHFSVTGKPEVDAIIEMKIVHQNIFLAKGKYGVMVEVADVTQDNFVANQYYTENSGTYTKVGTWPSTEPTKWFELHDAAEVTNDNGYWPVVYTMTGNTEYNSGDVKSDSLKVIAGLVADIINENVTNTQDTTDKSLYTYTGKKAIEQNTDIAGLKLDNIGLSWEWKFEQPTNTDIYDAADTILGNLMAERIGTDYAADVVKYGSETTYVQPIEGTDYCLDTQFDITIKATQVD